MEDVPENSGRQKERCKADIVQAITFLKSDIRRQKEALQAAGSEQSRALAAKQVAEKDLKLVRKGELEDKLNVLLTSPGKSKVTGEINCLKMQIQKLETSLVGVSAERTTEIKGKDLDSIYKACQNSYNESTLKYKEEQKNAARLQFELGKAQNLLRQCPPF